MHAVPCALLLVGLLAGCSSPAPTPADVANELASNLRDAGEVDLQASAEGQDLLSDVAAGMMNGDCGSADAWRVYGEISDGVLAAWAQTCLTHFGQDMDDAQREDAELLVDLQRMSQQYGGK